MCRRAEHQKSKKPLFFGGQSSFLGELERVLHTPKNELWNRQKNGPIEPTRTLARRAQRAVDSLDDRGAWVKTGRMKHHGSDDPTRAVILTKTFVKNLTALARWIAANQ